MAPRGHGKASCGPPGQMMGWCLAYPSPRLRPPPSPVPLPPGYRPAAAPLVLTVGASNDARVPAIPEPLPLSRSRTPPARTRLDLLEMVKSESEPTPRGPRVPVAPDSPQRTRLGCLAVTAAHGQHTAQRLHIPTSRSPSEGGPVARIQPVRGAPPCHPLVHPLVYPSRGARSRPRIADRTIADPDTTGPHATAGGPRTSLDR